MNASKVRLVTHEQITNRWNFDFYVFTAFDAFRNGDFSAFSEFTNIINSLVVRPIDGRSDIIIKLRFMQFLSRINNGDRLDITFEDPLTPLESALNVLKSICSDMNVPHKDHQRIHNSITEMLVIVCIRAGEFERAEQMLQKHFPKGMDSAGKKKLYMNLIRNRRCSHSALQNSYSDFKQDMLDFIDSLYSIPEPFLLKMLLSPESRREREESPQSSTSLQKLSTADYTCATSSPRRSASSSRAQVSLENLRQVYNKLSEVYGVSTPFSQLQRDVENEALMENRTQSDTELHLELTETPLQRNDTQEEEERNINISVESQINTQQEEEERNMEISGEPQNGTQQNSEEEEVGRNMDVSGEPQLNAQQDSEEGRKDPDVSAEQHSPVRSRYVGMTVSRLVMEDDSQASEDESQEGKESTQISIISPDRPSPQTRSIRRRNLSRMHSDPESPATPFVNQTHTKKNQNKRRRIAINPDPDPETQTETCHATPPPSVNQTHQEKQKETPPRHTRYSSSSPSVNQTQQEKQKETPLRHTRYSSSPPSANQTQQEKQKDTPLRHTRYSSSPPSANQTQQEKQKDTPLRHTRYSGSSPSVNQTQQEKQKETPPRHTRYSSSSPSVNKAQQEKQKETSPRHTRYSSSPLSANQTQQEKQKDTPLRHTRYSSSSSSVNQMQSETPVRHTRYSSSSPSVNQTQQEKQKETPPRHTRYTSSSPSVNKTQQGKQKETPPPQTNYSSSSPSLNQTQQEKETPPRHKRYSSASPSLKQTQQCKQRETPAREKQCAKSGVEFDCDQRTETSAHQTPVKQQDKRHIIVIDTESDSQQETDAPIETRHSSSSPSVTHTPREKQRETNSSGKKKQDKRYRIASDSESDFESEACRKTPSHHSSPLPSVSQTKTEKQRDKRARKWLDVSGIHEEWSDEDSLFSAAAGSSGHSRKEKQTRKKWTVEESNWLKEGVELFGEGRWGKIHLAFPFKDRTPVNLKDRWRTMKKLKM